MKVLMVCLGNICRSPMAQGALEQLVQKHQLNWEIDSAGTNGYHNGEPPDPRAVRAARSRGMDISRQISRQIKTVDLEYFDLVLAMDDRNLSYLFSMCKDETQKNKIKLLLDFALEVPDKQVPDPYYDDRFEYALDLIEKACASLVSNFKKN